MGSVCYSSCPTYHNGKYRIKMICIDRDVSDVWKHPLFKHLFPERCWHGAIQPSSLQAVTPSILTHQTPSSAEAACLCGLTLKHRRRLFPSTKLVPRKEETRCRYTWSVCLNIVNDCFQAAGWHHEGKVLLLFVEHACAAYL